MTTRFEGVHRAERRLGEMLRESERNKGAKGIGPIAVHSADSNIPTLPDLGISLEENCRALSTVILGIPSRVRAGRQARQGTGSPAGFHVFPRARGQAGSDKQSF